MLQMSIKTQLFVFVIVTMFGQFVCECIESYMTVCDDLSDFSSIADVDVSWTDLIIKPKRPNLISVYRSRFFNTFSNLRSLTIISQINDIKPHSKIDGWVPCELKLQYLSFYKNNFKNVKKTYFLTQLKLKKLSMIDNNIQTVEESTFTAPQIEIVDLSSNQIEVIKSGTFNNITKIIIIKNNKLILLEPNCFPDSLEILNLNNNQLIQIQDGAINQLVDLQELYLSHNKLLLIPQIIYLQKLRVLDLSHNKIINIASQTFKTSERLEILDLSNNHLTKMTFLKPLLLQVKLTLNVSLAFNLLRKFDPGTDVSLNHVVMILFGNPWKCDDWPRAEQFMIDRGLQRHECDLEHFNCGNLPYCIHCSSSEIDKTIERFLEAIECNKHMVTCKSAVKTQVGRFKVQKFCPPIPSS